MAKARKASAYSKRKPVINTRKSKVKKYSYVKSVPQQKVKKFNVGNVQKFEKGQFEIKGIIYCDENIQIRDMALEAARQSLNKDLQKLFQKNFFLKVHPYPHNILRNNRVFSGASKGERVQTGMRQSFGTPEGRAAVVKRGKPIFSVYFNDKNAIHKLRLGFKKATPKLPGKTKVNFEFLKHSI